MLGGPYTPPVHRETTKGDAPFLGVQVEMADILKGRFGNRVEVQFPKL